MKPGHNIFLWLVATVALSALTSWLISARKTSNAPSGTPRISGLSLHDWMHRQLHLTAGQHTALDPLETAYQEESTRLRDAAGRLGSELAQAMRDSESSGKILGIQKELNAAQGEMQRAALRHFIAMRSHLDPTQAEKFAIWTHDSILLQPSH